MCCTVYSQLTCPLSNPDNLFGIGLLVEDAVAEANVDPACVRQANFTSSVRVETADAQVLEKTVDSRFEKLSDAAIDSLVSEQKNKNTCRQLTNGSAYSTSIVKTQDVAVT